jgi:tetratricopeptide (TPR) repeat protein
MDSMSVPKSTSCVPAPEQLTRISKLYDEGLYLQAFREAESVGPLRHWASTKARLLAGRLAGNLGGQRLSHLLIVQAWRHDRKDPQACWFYARHLLDTRGPWAALQFMKAQGTFPDADRHERSHWLSLYAQVYGRARDFDKAAKWLAHAEALGGDDPWVVLERAALYALEDREDEALGAARRALEISPWQRSAVQWLAHFLVQKEQDEEALRLLQEASRRIESFAVAFQLANLQLETGRHAEARSTLEECVRLAPLLDKVTKPWLDARRCDAAYLCGDLEDACRWARELKGRFYEVQAERLKEQPVQRKRVCMPVGFVRQHHWTCAPATLTALCRFWSMPGTHLEVAAAITYAGTANHSERQWAIDQRWYSKEFTVTWESARLVLDAGIPFTLTTPEVSSSHLQAVIGYDDLRTTLILRDPTERHRAEMLAEGLSRYRASGPRGHALVPMQEKHRLESLTLPDTELYDQIFRMERALEAHDRAGAEAIYRTLTASAADHWMALLAERMLAAYDADSVRLLSSIEKLLALFADDLRLQLPRFSALRDLARRSEYLQLLEKLCKQVNTDPAFWELYAQELAGDARAWPEAERWLQRALRVNPTSARALSILAGIRWSQRHFEEALDLSRLAACLEEANEYLARSYFENANLLGRGEEGLEFLRRRYQRFGHKSGQPAQTLAWANFFLERTGAGYAVLEEAITLRPDDGQLQLAAVDQYVQHGRFAEARRLAVRARKNSHRGDWMRSVAYLEGAEGNLKRARSLWARVLAAQPLAEDAHRSYALLLAETVGRHATLEHLHSVCERFPHHLRLTHLLMDWLREDGPQAAEPVLRKLIDLHPSDAWARRQLALNLAEQHRLEEAFAALAAAEPLEPASLGFHCTHGALLRQAGLFEQAKEQFRAALRISADGTYAMTELVSVCQTPQERREALAFIQAEQERQVTSGSGLVAFRDLAARALAPADLLLSLRKALQARPDLWPAWAAVLRQLRFMGQLEPALELAQQALERFPLVSDLWVDLADIQQARRNDEAAIEALKTAHGITPFWPEPLQKLSELYRQRDECEKARTLIEGAIARAPLKAENYAILARFLWNSGQLHEGFDRMRHAVNLDPGMEHAWEELCDWAAKLGCFGAVMEFARELTARRPGEIRSWMRLAQALLAIPGKSLMDDAQRQEECLAALDRVLRLRPWLIEAHDLKAQVLAEAQRWVEAQEACLAPVWKGRPPTPLRGRLAWIVHLRGDADTAVELMAEAVRSDPEYYWGWRNLAEWYQELGEHTEHLQAAEQLITLEPYNPTNYVHRADARRALKDRAGAMADYQRAAELAPNFLYPQYQLFDMHLEDGNASAARQILDRADPTEARASFLLRSLLLARLENDTLTALEALEDLCVSGKEAQLEEGVRALEEAGLGAEAEDVLHRFLGTGRSVCNQWVQLVARRSSLEAVRESILRLTPKHLARLNVTVAYADALAEAAMKQRLCDWVGENETLLRKKTWSWGQIGSHFSRVLDDERTAAWMRDWQEREGVQPWMLMNLSLAVRGLDRFAEGAAINRYVLENYESDYTSIYHRTWLMLDAVLANDVAAAVEFFHAHDLNELDANHRWVATLARAILMCLTSTDRAQTLADVHDSLTHAKTKLEPIDRDQVFLLVYQKCIRHMVLLAGVPGGTWEQAHLETPVYPRLKPRPEDQ